MTNFVITPLSFLSGTFYSIGSLPKFWHAVAHLDPFFYMIDGFRYGFTGHADGSLLAGLLTLTGVNVALWVVAYRMFQRGYKLKA
jgi:ABC-2 type transport system permease protein